MALTKYEFSFQHECTNGQLTPSPTDPYFFMTVQVIPTGTGSISASLGTSLAGSIVSSSYRLKDLNNVEGAYFIFGDLSIKAEGSLKLRFNLYEVRNDSSAAFYITSVDSDPFTVFPAKNWPGMMESTPLTRHFCDQGIRLRLRKEPKSLLRKRGPASEEYVPRRYNRTNQQRQQSQAGRNNEYDQTSPISPVVASLGQRDRRESSQSTQPYPQDIHNQSYPYEDAGSFDSQGNGPLPKRPRTGSEQHSHNPPPLFTPQQQLLGSPQSQYSGGMFGEQQSYMASPQQPQYQVQSNYPQPPIAGHREGLFTSRNMNAPAFQIPHHASPTGYYPQAHYQQPLQQHQPNYPVTPTGTGVTQDFQGLNVVERSHLSETGFRSGLPAPVPFFQESYGHVQRREPYELYPTPSQNLSTGDMGMITRPLSDATSTTSAPDDAEGPYQ